MNVFACLVHESPECVIDLVQNLRCLDRDSAVLLYDGSRDGSLAPQLAFDDELVVIHPSPRPMSWGRLHDFALDCMQFALECMPQFGSLTIVDSDQLALRPGHSGAIAACLEQHPQAGFLGNAASTQPPTTRIGPPQAAWREFELWRPLLRRFPDGESKFPQWSFWPSSVFTRRAVEDLVSFWGNEELQRILGRSALWATEEVILPTLVALLGHDVALSPCRYDFVTYRGRYSVADVDVALARPDVYWMHPVPRRYDDPLRMRIRTAHDSYAAPIALRPPVTFNRDARPSILRILPILERIAPLEGWLSPEEGDLLAAAAAQALGEGDAPQHLVQVGSCLRSAVVLGSVAHVVAPDAKVLVIDPPGGDDPSGGRASNPAGVERRRQAIAALGLAGTVDLRASEAHDVEWTAPVGMLLVDGRHDFATVVADLSHFERHLAVGALVAFHDYASYAPGVTKAVDDLARSERYETVDRAGGLALLRKRSAATGVSIGPILDQMETVDGWLDRGEAALLALLASSVAAGPNPGDIVEVGSFCGRGTVVLGGVVRDLGGSNRVVAVDAFDGVVGSADGPLVRMGPTLDRFRASIREARLEGVVDVLVSRAPETFWDRRIGLLVIDGLHDLASVAADFIHFEPSLAPGAVVAFHDYADYFPGVRAFVGKLLLGGCFEEIAREGTVIALRRVGTAAKRSAVPARLPVVTRSRPNSINPESAHGPLVSCIMPTYDRRPWVPRAIECFLAQDYPNRELIVVDDGSDAVEDLMPEDPRVRYVRLAVRRSIGAKRNLAAEAARGELLAHLDDDDWYADGWLRQAVQTLGDGDVDIAGLDTLLFFDPALSKAWRYEYPRECRPWLADATFCYRRRLWLAHPFPDSSYGIDTQYLWSGVTEKLARVPDHRLFVATVHSGNTSYKRTTDPWWHPYPADEVRSLMSGNGNHPLDQNGLILTERQ